MGLTRVITRPCATRTTYRMSLILFVGTSVSAIRFRRPGSSFKHCRLDVLIARSNSSRLRSEYMNGSAPDSKRRRSKLLRRSNMRLSCSAETTLRIWRWRYSRWKRVFHTLRFTPARHTRIVQRGTQQERYAHPTRVYAAQLVTVVQEDGYKSLHEADDGRAMVRVCIRADEDGLASVGQNEVLARRIVCGIRCM